MRVAVHFDASWQPNGWTSREGARMLALGITVFLLAVFTIAGYAMRRPPVSALSRWTMVVVFYIVLSLVYFVNKWIVERNFNGQQPEAAVAAVIDSGDLHVLSDQHYESLKLHS